MVKLSTHVTQLKTRYSESDQGGIIHHSSYLIYLETARIEFLQELGIAINDVEKAGFFCPVVSLQCDFIKPLCSLQEIEIRTHLEKFTKVRFTLSYEIFCGAQRVLTGKTNHCFLNRSFKPIPIPQTVVQVFEKIA